MLRSEFAIALCIFCLKCLRTTNKNGKFDYAMSKSSTVASAAATIPWLPLVCFLGVAQHSSALEVLTVQELMLHCDYLAANPDGADGQYCIRYVQGFIDGAVETDDRIMQDIAADSSRHIIYDNTYGDP